MRNKLFTLLLLILFGMGISILLKPQNEVSVREKRYLNTRNDIQFTNKLSSSTEGVLKDQFFERDLIVNCYYSMNTKLGNVYNLISSNIVSSDLLGEIHINYLGNDVAEIDNNYLISNIPNYSENEISSASSRGYNVNEFDLRYPNVKTYVYFPTRIEEYLNSEHPNETVSREKYKNQLNSNIKTSSLIINSVEEYSKYYYKTEEHWNGIGAYQGYSDVINMISSDFNIDGPRDILDKIEYPYTFKGNISSKIGWYESSDSIIDLKLDGVKEFDFYQDGVKLDYYANKEEYKMNGNTSVYSDYDYYFGGYPFLRLFDFKQNDKPNLLIFADSYVNANMMWIASHFNQTIIIDLRSKPENFSMDYYINEYNIDASLVLLSYHTMYLNGNMYIPLN